MVTWGRYFVTPEDCHEPLKTVVNHPRKSRLGGEQIATFIQAPLYKMRGLILSTPCCFFRFQ